MTIYAIEINARGKPHGWTAKDQDEQVRIIDARLGDVHPAVFMRFDSYTDYTHNPSHSLIEAGDADIDRHGHNHFAIFWNIEDQCRLGKSYESQEDLDAAEAHYWDDALEEDENLKDLSYYHSEEEARDAVREASIGILDKANEARILRLLSELGLKPLLEDK